MTWSIGSACFDSLDFSAVGSIGEASIGDFEDIQREEGTSSSFSL